MLISATYSHWIYLTVTPEYCLASQNLCLSRYLNQYYSIFCHCIWNEVQEWCFLLAGRATFHPPLLWCIVSVGIKWLFSAFIVFLLCSHAVNTAVHVPSLNILTGASEARGCVNCPEGDQGEDEERQLSFWSIWMIMNAFSVLAWRVPRTPPCKLRLHCCPSCCYRKRINTFWPVGRSRAEVCC